MTSSQPLKEPQTPSQTKSKQRVADHGEVFTNEREVKAMLDLVAQETDRIDSRFLEPACGNGNFLAEILRRKLAVVKSRYGKSVAEYERYAVIAVTSVYGVDILEDNVAECRHRLFEIFDREYTLVCGHEAEDDTRASVRHILNHNILCGDALTMERADNSPIIFAEWSAVNSHLIKRRDFRLDQMLADAKGYVQLDMFGLSPAYEQLEMSFTQELILAPVREFPPTDYRRLRDE
ncbi:MAG: SAM-dependent DNA methyltransferase [Burkholderiales bacterium]|jgi:SAM-dependent methyltransferase|nr:SAM-dependent DNA methyltransferase [Burkholderiales bacterium]